MDLSCNRHLQQHLQQQRTPSEDDEDISNYSRDFQPMNGGGSALTSDSESGPPISVRDMIKRYNSASSSPTNKTVVAVMTAPPPTQRRTSQHALPTTRSSYCGMNKFGSQSNVRQYVSQLQETVAAEKTKLCSRNCLCNIDNNNSNSKEDNCCLSPRGRRNSLKSVKSVKSLKSLKSSNCGAGNEIDLNHKLFVSDHIGRTRSPISDANELRGVTPAITLNTSTSKERIRLQSAESIDEANFPPIESSYQSKTTIAKTASGVRIIIDIFFDQEQNVSPTDVIGSRVETDIPQSRILSEFQQQALSSSISQASATSASISQGGAHI